MPDNLKDIVLSMSKKGNSVSDITKVVEKDLPALSHKQVYNKVRDLLRDRSNEPYEIRRKKLRKLAREEKESKVIVQNFTPTEAEYCWDGSSIIKFGLIGDTHLNSKYTQISSLRDYYRICSNLGVKDVYHTGDIDDGDSMRVGHQYELYNQGGDDHIKHIVKVYPQIKGIKTHFITGNHDASIYKRSGVDIGFRIEQERKDLEYLGPDVCDIKITDNCTLELRHPWDGTAYAVSYKPQKIVESLDPNNRPNILAIGHYHKQEYLMYHGVHIFQTGTFCAQTNYMRGKGISAAIGGWIISLVVDKEGYMRSMTPTFIPYEPILEDYRNWI